MTPTLILGFNQKTKLTKTHWLQENGNGNANSFLHFGLQNYHTSFLQHSTVWRKKCVLFQNFDPLVFYLCLGQFTPLMSKYTFFAVIIILTIYNTYCIIQYHCMPVITFKHNGDIKSFFSFYYNSLFCVLLRVTHRFHSSRYLFLHDYTGLLTGVEKPFNILQELHLFPAGCLLHPFLCALPWAFPCCFSPVFAVIGKQIE